MLVKLHQNGRATPAIRWAIQSSSLSASQLAARHGCSWLSMSFWPSFANASTQRSRVPDSTAVCAGMVERFNGRIEEMLRQTRFAGANELATTIGHCAKLADARTRRPCQAIVHCWIPCGHGVKSVRICLSKTGQRFHHPLQRAILTLTALLYSNNSRQVLSKILTIVKTLLKKTITREERILRLILPTAPSIKKTARIKRARRPSSADIHSNTTRRLSFCNRALSQFSIFVRSTRLMGFAAERRT